MSFTLYTYPNNYRAQKALIAAEYTGLSIDVPDEFKFPDHAKSPDFKAKNPVQKVPVLETPQGTLFESNAILRYVSRCRPEANLSGGPFYEQGLVDQWIDFSANEFEPARNVWIYPLLGFMKYNKAAANKSRNDVEKALRVLEEHLLLRTFVVGERVTLADIALGAALVALFQRVFDPSFREKFVNVTRWFTTLINQPEWKTVLGTVTLCETEQQPELPKKNAKQAKQSKQNQVKKSESEQPVPKKVKNPLDLLKRSEKMDLDTTKRTFSNNPFPKALEMFYSTWDPEGFCLYTSVYNYNDENTSDFQTSNLVGGWLQRLDSLRKYGFGCVAIFGVEDTKGPFTITGAWVFRGSQPPAEFVECPDSEYHTITRVDLNNPTSKAHFEALLGGVDVLPDSSPSIPCYERKYLK